MKLQSLNDYVKTLKQNLGDKIVKVETKEEKNEIWIYTKREHLVDVCDFIFNKLGGYLSTMIGTDMRQVNNSYELCYVFSMEGNCEMQVKPWINVVTYIPQDEPEFPATTPRVPAAWWYEREVKDLLGITPKGHPDLRRLVLPDDWPEDVYPLRKDVPYNVRPPSKPAEYEFRPKVEGEGLIEIPIGPVHAACDEPAQFRLFTDGEYVIDIDYRMFYVHRGLEKLAESVRTYNQVCFLAERICGICGFAHSCAYCQAVESAMDLEIPERAKYIRTIALEVERLHSHLLNLGIACHLVAFDWGFMTLFKIRERIMKIAEILTGGRKTYGLNLVGGVRRDIPEYRKQKILEELHTFKKEFEDAIEKIMSNNFLIGRASEIGILSKEVAREVCVVGPVARGSGIQRDTRKDHPYAAYKDIYFKVPVRKEGDILARLSIRVEEIRESINIIEQALDELPGGPIMESSEKYRIDPLSKGIGYVEAPRGEDVHFVILGYHSKVYRWRIRASTYNNWPALPYMCRGYTIADVPLIIASLDPCYSCTERVIVMDRKNRRKKRVYSYSYLIKLSRKKSKEMVM